MRAIIFNNKILTFSYKLIDKGIDIFNISNKNGIFIEILFQLSVARHSSGSAEVNVSPLQVNGLASLSSLEMIR
jgi:hypothetical protein